HPSRRRPLPPSFPTRRSSDLVHEKQELDDAMQELSTLNIMQLATKQVISLPDTASLADAIAALSDARLKKVPVTNRDGSMEPSRARQSTRLNSSHGSDPYAGF